MNEALKTAIKAADDKKALDIVALDISQVCSFADYFLLCTGDSSRQIQAIAEEVREKLQAGGYRPAHVEGYDHAEWILLDYLDLVVHVFSKQARDYYDLERLWRDAKVLDVGKALGVSGTKAAPERRPRQRTRLRSQDGA
jgi:ribosome-associated protein